MAIEPIRTICIVGTGFMGVQIGVQLAMHGYPVWLYDASQRVLQGASQELTQEIDARVALQQVAEAQKQAILDRCHLTADLREGVSRADLVIEVVPERLDLKRQVFSQLDQLCPPQTIIATNSSSIRVSRIEDVTQRRDRVLNLHFFAPVRQCPLVELMRGTATSDETIARVRDLARSAGLVPLIVRKESRGFILNRVWRAVKKECLRVVDQGVASHEDVDRAWMIFYNQPIGPFGKMDLIGLDVIRDIELVYYQESGDPSDYPPRVLLDKIERGELGVKTGKGFYTYPHPAYEDPDWLKGGES